MPYLARKPDAGADLTQGLNGGPSHSSSANNHDEKAVAAHNTRSTSSRQQRHHHAAHQVDHHHHATRTPHGFHEQRRTVGRMTTTTTDSDLIDSGVSPGLLSDALLLRGLGTKQVHHIPAGSASSSESGDRPAQHGFHSIPPPPLVSATAAEAAGGASNKNNKKRASPQQSNNSGTARSVRQRRSLTLPTAAHRPHPAAAAVVSSGSATAASASAAVKKQKNKAKGSRGATKQQQPPATHNHRLQQKSTKANKQQAKAATKRDPKFDAAAALTSLSHSSDSDESSESNGSPRDWSRGGSKTARGEKDRGQDLERQDQRRQQTEEQQPAMLHGLIPISSLSNQNRTPMLVNHSYTDYSIVDPTSLALLDEDQGLSPSGFEWEGLNHDPHYPSIPGGGGGGADGEDGEEEEDVDVTGTDAAAAKAYGEEMTGPEFERERAKTVKKLRRIFKGIRPSRRNSGGVVQPFPGKLMEVLDREDIDDILSWMPHGRAFVVRQPKVFTTDVLPRFFKQSKYMSFTRQLNLWGFKRITRGRDAGAYYHELFLRGRPRLTLRMRRQKIKGTGIKLTPNPDAEPDFYLMAKSRPLPRPVVAGARSTPKPMPPVILSSAIAHAGRALVKGRQSRSARSSGGGANADGVAEAAESTSDYIPPFFPVRGGVVPEEAGSSPSAATAAAAAKPAVRSASFDRQDGRCGYAEEPDAAAAGGRSRTYSEEDAAAAIPLQKESASSSSSTGVDKALLAAEVLRQRELAAAELLLGARKESPLEALLRLQAAELKQKQDAVLTSQGLLRQLDGIIPGTPAARPANTVAELQRRLLAAAAALDQPSVQAAVMEEQRRNQLAALLASTGSCPLSPLSSLLGGGVGGMIGSELGLLGRLSSDASTLELLKMRAAGTLGGLGGASSASGAAAAAAAAGADGITSPSDILGLAAALEAQNAKDECKISAALQQYSAAAPSSPSLAAAAAACPGSPTVSVLRLGGSAAAAEEDVMKAMGAMRN